MKEELKLAKQEMKDQIRPYQVYGYYLALPIIIILVFVLSYLGMDVNSLGTIVFVFTILAHIGASKLKDVSKIKHVAPILMYVVNAVGITMLISMFSYMLNGGSVEVYLGLMGLVVLPLEIAAIVFFFITANDIKKAYPAMKQESKNAREKYIAMKKNSRG